MSGQLDTADRARLARSGIKALPTAAGLALLDSALRTDAALLVAAALDRASLRTTAPDELPALLRTLVPARRRTGGAKPAVAGGTWLQSIGALNVVERESRALELVRTAVATVLGHADAGTVEADRALKELGFDSLTAVELRNRLNAATGLRLPASLVFDHPTAQAIAAHLAQSASRPTGVAAPDAGRITDEVNELEELFAAPASPREIFALIDASS
jgi:acyl carrier protein